MKKTMKTLLALMAGVMTFSACSNEDVLINETPNVKPEVKGIRTFTAFTESNPATRATIDGMSVKWQENDEISVMSDNDHFDYYRLTDGANTTSGTFEAEYDGVFGNPIYAVYPMALCKAQEVTLDDAANAAAGYTGVTYAIATAVLEGTANGVQQGKWENSGAENDPIVQAYLNGGYLYTSGYPVDGSTIKELYLVYNQTVDPGEMVCSSGVKMVAKADDANNLAFKNVCSYIKVTTTTPLNRIEVKANNGEYLSGKFDVDFSSEVPVPSAAYALGTTNVMFAASAGDLAPGTYYIAVLPGTLAGGLTIEYYTDENNHIDKSTSSSFTFVRNKIHDAGSQPAAAPATTGTAAATGIGNVGWVQLWSDGPKFAEFNVGVTDGKAESFGGYYAWGGSQDKVDDHNTGSATLTGDADTATKLWGSAWRMPTKAEFDALLAHCDVEWTTVNGVNGRKYTGQGGYASNSVFLPAAGGWWGSAYGQGDGYYWSSTTEDGYYAYYLYFDSGIQTVFDYDRDQGYSVRAVLAE